MKQFHVSREATIRDALEIIENAARGIAFLVDDEGKLLRTVTDGDLRRLILAGSDLEEPVSQLPAQQSIIGNLKMTRVEAIETMDKAQINHLPIVDSEGRIEDLWDRRTISERILLSVPHMGDLERAYVEEAFETNWIAPVGPHIDAFETELAEKVGAGSAAAVSSGTAALHLALRVLDVGEGDTVFCSTFTFIASANPIIYQNARPVFIDSEPQSWNMSPIALERALQDAKSAGKLPKAIVVVNLYGQSADMDPIMDLADTFGVPVVEDAAESLGGLYKGKASGTIGRIGIYSFNGNKIITTSGGGMLVSDDDELVQKAKFLSTQAKEPVIHYEHKEIGYNYRMSNILAGIGRGQLQILDERVAKRRKVFDTYRELLAGTEAVEWMPEPDWSFSNRWLSTCTIKPKNQDFAMNELIHGLGQELIEARPLWKPMHRQPVFEGCDYYTHGNESVSDQLFESGLCLPSGTSMNDNDIERVAATLLSNLK